MLTIEARPTEVELDPRRTAVLVIDMQNDFGSPGGMFDRAGVDISGIQAAARATRPVLQGARAADLPEAGDVIVSKHRYSGFFQNEPRRHAPELRRYAPARRRLHGPTRGAIVGTDARIEIDGNFYAPTSFDLISRTRERSRFEPPRKGHGLWYEAEEVAHCLREGLLESPLMPLDESVEIMRTMDAVLAQAGAN